jgi:hypothetical protein
MVVAEKLIQKIDITEVQGLDPISVYLEDPTPGKGRITIICYGESWTASWGSMGNRTISEFFKSCDNQYLAKNLSKIPSEINDPDALIKDMKKTIIKNRRSRGWGPNDSRNLFDDISLYDYNSLLDSSGEAKSTLIPKVYGNEWWYCIPKKENPDYTYLCRIIDAVKEALKQI